MYSIVYGRPNAPHGDSILHPHLYNLKPLASHSACVLAVSFVKNPEILQSVICDKLDADEIVPSRLKKLLLLPVFAKMFSQCKSDIKAKPL